MQVNLLTSINLKIAALLDRTFPGEHRFLFWNIVITYLFSVSPVFMRLLRYLAAY